jgi:hypothetical protein
MWGSQVCALSTKGEAPVLPLQDMEKTHGLKVF